MFKYLVFFAVLAVVAFAAPEAKPVWSSYYGTPYAYSAGYAAPYTAYSGYGSYGVSPYHYY